jgi:hypothetical protein
VDRTAALRWAVLTLALAASVGLSAYWTALASRPVETLPPVPQPRPPAPVHAPAARHDPGLAARDRAYRRGRRAGFGEGQRAARRKLRRRLGGFARWEGAYLVLSSRDGRGIRGRIGPLRPGVRYELCRGGRQICVRPRG